MNYRQSFGQLQFDDQLPENSNIARSTGTVTGIYQNNTLVLILAATNQISLFLSTDNIQPTVLPGKTVSVTYKIVNNNPGARGSLVTYDDVNRVTIKYPGDSSIAPLTFDPVDIPVGRIQDYSLVDNNLLEIVETFQNRVSSLTNRSRINAIYTADLTKPNNNWLQITWI